MSSSLFSRNEDLRRLRDEGYDVAVDDGHLVIRQVPYLDASGSVQYGVLVTALALANDLTIPPADHTVRFVGSQPYSAAGEPLDKLANSAGDEVLAIGLTANFSFSHKPAGGYTDHYEKMTAYIRILANQAVAKESAVTATPFPIHTEEEGSDSPFVYTDTASSRAQIGALSTRFIGQKIAIIGLGGTGSYILDLVSKTPVAEIHLYDADDFVQHNAFRAPGAAIGSEIEGRPLKVNYFHAKYSAIHRGITPHPTFVTEGDLDTFGDFDFVFIAIDDGPAKRPIVESLEQQEVAFIDCGMGLAVVDEKISGSLRVTLSSEEKRSHVRDRARIPFDAAAADGEYGRNIQLADLNALNASLAVIRWKRHVGFYADLEHEHNSVYAIDGNHLLNEDTA